MGSRNIRAATVAGTEWASGSGSETGGGVNSAGLEARVRNSNSIPVVIVINKERPKFLSDHSVQRSANSW